MEFGSRWMEQAEETAEIITEILNGISAIKSN